jgi:hypothetical protein
MSAKHRRSSKELDATILQIVKRAGGSILGAEITAKAAKLSDPISRSDVYKIANRVVASGELEVTGTRGSQVYSIPSTAPRDRVKKAARRAALNGGVSREHTTLGPLDELLRVTHELAAAEARIVMLRERKEQLTREVEERIE